MVLDPESGSVVDPNTFILCSAESNPEPEFYQWFDEEDEVIDFGFALTIPPECAGLEVCITCLALNEMRDGNLGQGTKSGCYNVTSLGKCLVFERLQIVTVMKNRFDFFRS